MHLPELTLPRCYTSPYMVKPSRTGHMELWHICGQRIQSKESKSPSLQLALVLPPRSSNLSPAWSCALPLQVPSSTELSVLSCPSPYLAAPYGLTQPQFSSG